MGEHSPVKRGTEALGRPNGVQRRPWTVRRTVFTMLGSIVALSIVAGATCATLGNWPGSVGGSSARSLPAHATSLQQLPVGTALTGREAVAWADAALTALGAPRTSANVQTIVDWFANEGTPHDFNNPLNLQTPYGGSTVSTANGSSSDNRIQAYPAPEDFVAAFPLEMNNGSYPAIVSALKAGKGLEGFAANQTISTELSVYSGGGYNSIPADYNR
jgi:type II secretory pathway pseudopilin PulG